MQRRQFIKYLGLAGLSVGLPAMPRVGWANENLHTGPYWITIHAGGGWDPTLFCDPKGKLGTDDPNPVNQYFQDEILEIGPFRSAPVPGHLEFFERFRNQLMVINGIDMGTNSHQIGTRHTWSGSIDVGSPSFSALVASTTANRPSLPYITNGGYGNTAQLIAPTRIPDISAIEEIAYPNRLISDDDSSGLFTRNTWARLQKARADRTERLHAAQEMPYLKRSIQRFKESRTTNNELVALLEHLPSSLDHSTNQLLRQGQLALAAFKAGLTVSADLTIGGFDTHGDHDAQHTPRIQQILAAITFIMDQAQTMGISDQLNIIVGSDFSRTPSYNENNGKDHWSIGSMMLMGPGIPGGKVIGATDHTQNPLTVDPVNLELNPDGIRLTPGHIHASLRELAGISTHANAARFDVSDLLPLFTS